MKKKVLAMLLVCAMVLSACGAKEEETKTEAPAPAATEGAAAEEAEEEAPAWQPSDDVEWVVTSSAGGGSDIFTRMITDIMKNEGIVNETFLVNNQTDGGGEVGRLRVSTEKNDGHLLLTFNSGDLTPMVQNTDNRVENFKVIGIMAVDRHLILSGQKTSYGSFAEALDAAANGTKITIGGSKGDDLRLYEMLLQETGLTEADITYIMHDATSDAITALLGGHVDYCIAKPAAATPYIESGDTKAEVALAKERFGGALADVPLLSEATDLNDIESPIWRGVVGPAAMSDEAVQFWSDALKAVSETETWQKEYIENNLLTAMYMSAEEADAYMKEYQENFLATLAE